MSLTARISLSQFLAAGLLLGGSWFCEAHSLADDRAPASAGGAAESRSDSGIIEGQIFYSRDPQRPWRYARYYVKGPVRGYLAEAVVTLQGTGLREASPSRESRTANMDQRDFQFVPETLAIRAGDRVHFRNSDAQVHNVRTYDGIRPFNVNTPMGGEYTHLFERATGIRSPIRIGCSYHGQMRAWIFVFPHDFSHVTGADGAFRWSGVPPGQYEIQVVHPAGSLRTSQPVTVRPGAVVPVEIELSPDHLVEEKP
ncbi:MAG: carboxypeptidase regulatory-like domain-containing protein [Pirellulaceae bacterium]